MKNKWFLKGFMFCLAFMAIIVLTYTASSGYYGLPYSQETSFQTGNLFSNYNLDSSLYSAFGLQTSSYNEFFSNPFLNISNTGSFYLDPISAATEQNFTYNNTLFGVSFETGSYGYQDPFLAASGQHTYAGTPVASFESNYDIMQSVAGSSFQAGSSFDSAWTHYESQYAMNASPFGQIAGGASMAYGKNPMLSLNPEISGLMSLILFTPSAEIGRAMGDTPMYTSEGMEFYGNPYYFNPYNASGWYFDAGVQSSTVASTPLI